MSFLLCVFCPWLKHLLLSHCSYLLLPSSSEKRGLKRDAESMWWPLSVENLALGRPQRGLVILGEEKKNKRSSSLWEKLGWKHLTQQFNSLNKKKVRDQTREAITVDGDRKIKKQLLREREGNSLFCWPGFAGNSLWKNTNMSCVRILPKTPTFIFSLWMTINV